MDRYGQAVASPLVSRQYVVEFHVSLPPEFDRAVLLRQD